jgi:hypothetical protein
MSYIKKVCQLVTVLVIMLISFPAVLAANLPPSDGILDMSVSLNGDIIVNGKMLQAPAPYINSYEGNIMVPLRAVGENLGYEILWDGTEQSIQVGQDIKIWIDRDYYTFASSEPIFFGPAPQLAEGRAFVSLPFFRNVLGHNSYVQEGRIIIESNKTNTVISSIPL